MSYIELRWQCELGHSDNGPAEEVQAVSELPSDFKARPLGTRGDLIAAVLFAAPTADFSDPSWGHIVTHDFSIDVNTGKEEQVEAIMLHVRGSNGAIELISEILERLNARALDIRSGELFDEPSAATSLAT